ncbi:MAG TPA: DEAD/DEAH box helicase [Ornithinibacter sp.]|nr:DEAD/DEAH box helicase [Ornithinibacter sp.]
MRIEAFPLTTFRDLGVLPETCAALEAIGITEPFAIQEQTLPVALAGNDVIGQAKTGTGKTLGFGIPLLQRVTGPQDTGFGDLADPGKPQALVVVPTRELCVQVTRDIQTAGGLRGVRVLAVYGGRAYEPQVEALRKGIEVVVGTPGRLIDLANQKHLDLGHVRMLVLDEADEMLDLGFLPDVERILRFIPDGRQTMLFSATMPGPVISLARQYMTQPTHIRAHDPEDAGLTVANVEQHVFRAHALDKVEMLARILQAQGRGQTMVFCRTKRTAQKVADELGIRGFASGAVHGDLGQGAREQALRAFRNGKVDVLVATDVAARGIDVEGVTHVVNYQCPEDEKTYLHRIGRTARAGASGTAVTFVDWDDIPRWTLINKALGLDFESPAETYSTSDHFYEALDIPRHAGGELPKSERTRAGLEAEAVEDLGETGKARGRGDAGQPPSGSRSGKSSPAPESKPRPARTRSGQRQRTRSGAPVAATTTENHDGGQPRTLDGEGAPSTGRRRRRGGRGKGGGSSATASTSTGGSGDAKAVSDQPV